MKWRFIGRESAFHDLFTMNVEALRDERNLCSALISAAEDWMCQINDELMRRGAKI